jgi:Tfp pilus assembly protein PilF
VNDRINQLKKFLEEEPDDSFLRYAYALELNGQGEHALALQGLQSLLADDPSYLPAYYIAGKTAEVLGQTVLAKKCYEDGKNLAMEQGNSQTLNELNAALDSLE